MLDQGLGLLLGCLLPLARMRVAGVDAVNADDLLAWATEQAGTSLFSLAFLTAVHRRGGALNGSPAFTSPATRCVCGRPYSVLPTRLGRVALEDPA